MHDALLIAAAFVASAVEMVEALTIVLAVGVTRGWRSALLGVAAAVVVLAGVVAALGPALARLPIDGLRIVIGALLLVFGLQWLRKAILRAGGVLAQHDEEAIYRDEARAALAAPRRPGALDWYTFTIAFKGVLLEGLEVAFIVVTFGGSRHGVGLAAVGAGAAVVLVATAGVALHRPLSLVPENAMKFAVGIMLTGFGTFWGAEGTGVRWPGGDVALLGVLAFVAAVAAVLVAGLRRLQPAEPSAVTA